MGLGAQLGLLLAKLSLLAILRLTGLRLAGLGSLEATLLLAELRLTGLGSLEATLLLTELRLTGLGSLEATLLLTELALLLPHLHTGERATKGIRVVDRRDRSILQLHEQEAARNAERDREQQQHVRTKARVDVVITKRDKELNDTKQRHHKRADARRQVGPLLIREPVGDAQADDSHQHDEMECRVSTLRGEHRRTSIVIADVRQQHRDEDQHRRRGDTDERVGRTNGTTAHLARFGHDGRLELVERRICSSAELLTRRRAGRSVTRLTKLLLAGLAEGSLLTLLRLRTELLLAGLTEGGLLALLRLATKLRLTLLRLAGLTEGGLLALLRLATKLRLTLLRLAGLTEGGLLALLRLAAELRLPLLRSSAVLGLAEGSLLTLRLSICLGLALRLSICLRRVAEGRLRDLLLGRRGRSGLVTRGSLGLRRTLKNRLLEVILGGLGHGSLGLDVGSLGLDVGSLGFCGSLDVGLFDGGCVSFGVRFLVSTGERLGLLAGFLCGSLGLGDGRLLGSRGLRGNDTLIRQPLPEGRVQRRVRCDVGTQVRASGSDIREILGRKRRIAQVGSGELRRIDSAHLYSSRTRRCSS